MEPEDTKDESGVISVESGRSALTGQMEGPIDYDRIYGADEMSDDPRLEKVFSLIRELLADEREKTIADMLKGAKSPSSSGFNKAAMSGKSENARRAPSGSARILCERTLGEAREGGLMAMKIHELADTEYEKMLSMSAVRNELSVGEKDKPARYRQVGGVWYLAKYAPLMKVVN